MPNQVKLDCFTVMIKKRGEEEFLGFDDFFAEITPSKAKKVNSSEKKPFAEFFKKYVGSFDGKFSVHKPTKQAMAIKAGTVSYGSSQRIISGIIEGGSVGSGNTIKNIDNADDEKGVFEMTDKHVDSTPYYFLLWLPSDSNQGILIVQGFSHKSITDTFRVHLRTFFRTVTKSLSLQIFNYVSKEFVEKLKRDSVINTVILRRKQLTGDKAAKLLQQKYAISESLTVEVKVSGLKGVPGFKNRIEEFMSGKNTQLFDIPDDIDEIGIDGEHEVIVEFDHGGKTATAKASKNFNIAPSYYVKESDLKFNSKGNPTKESLHTYSLSFLEQLKDEIGYKRSKR